MPIRSQDDSTSRVAVQEKEYFNNNFEQIKQQFISSNISNDNELII